jgi:hypothetical protein
MEMGDSQQMREGPCGPRSIQRLKRPTMCNMFPITLCVCRTHCQQAAVRLRDRSTAFGCLLAASHLEIFTGVSIEVILGSLIGGARLRWAAGADNEPTATEGGDPSDTYKRWFGRVLRARWLAARFIVSQELVLAGMPLRDARRLVATRAIGSNGWTLRCSCCADCLGP